MMTMQRITLSLTLLLVIASAKAGETLTVQSAVKKMSPGINLGNTLEAIPKEISWGNPIPNEAYFHAVKRAGFRSIRIPIAWTQYSDKANKIDPKWMSHVKDVVRMSTKQGLYTMINIHWDGGWQVPTFAKQAEVNAKMRTFWTQIAIAFRDFDDHVLFAGNNEVAMPGQYGPPSPENAEVQNGFNQLFINTVRATGGNNRTRFLVVQSYATDIENGLKFNSVMPKDPVKGKLMMEIHYYSPYNFTINPKSKIWQWGKTATEPQSAETWANEAYVDKLYSKLKTAYVDKGYPVLLGEYATENKPRYPQMNTYRKLWIDYITRAAYKNGIVPMYWDTGWLFDRKTGKQKDPEVIKILVNATK